LTLSSRLTTGILEGPRRADSQSRGALTDHSATGGHMSTFTYDLARFIDFRDTAELARVRTIPRSQITLHANPEFKIRVEDDPDAFYSAFAADIVGRIESTRAEGRRCVLILPVGPVPQFTKAVEIINRRRISMDHVHTFNMDEYADEDGVTAPTSWEGSFQRTMFEVFFDRIDADLRPPPEQIHFPSTATIDGYGDAIAELGGADACYGGIGWCGHIAFWESDLGHEFQGDLEAYKRAGPRIVELTPMTVMQNALHSFGGDWSAVPPKAATIGPAEILGAKHRSFWLDGDLGGGISWQRFIARLVAHGPVSEFVPGSLLQTAPTDYTMLGGVADDVAIDMS
jgi:glucosamine-6-phosphate deaminase